MSIILSKLVQTATEIEAGHTLKAEGLLAQIQTMVAQQATPLERLSYLFVQALQARLHGDLSGAGNLYSIGESLTEQNMLLTYQILVEATPLIRFGYDYANRTLFQALKDDPDIHLVDIGIGMGTQWLDFFDRMANEEHSIEHIRLTGIDLPFSEAEPLQRLNQMALMFQTKAADLGLNLTVHPIAANIETFDFANLALSSGETLAVSATLALHHTPAADAVVDVAQSRDAILNRIRQLKPRIMTLIEPDSEHNALPLAQRLPEAFRHYGAIFEALDSLLSDSSRVKRILENDFFGQEIINVIAAEGQARVERHERSDAWRKRLSGLGFRLIPTSPLAVRQGRQRLNLSSPFALHLDRGIMHLNFADTSILAASTWGV